MHHQAGEAVHDPEGGEGEVGVEEAPEENADDEDGAHLRRRVEHERPRESPQLAEAGGGTGHGRKRPEVARREEGRDDRLHRHAGDEGRGPRRRPRHEPGQQHEGDAEGGEAGEGAPRDEHGAAVDHEHAEGERAGDEDGGAQAKDEGRELRLPDRGGARAEEAAVEPVPGRGERHREGERYRPGGDEAEEAEQGEDRAAVPQPGDGHEVRDLGRAPAGVVGGERDVEPGEARGGVGKAGEEGVDDRFRDRVELGHEDEGREEPPRRADGDRGHAGRRGGRSPRPCGAAPGLGPPIGTRAGTRLRSARGRPRRWRRGGLRARRGRGRRGCLRGLRVALRGTFPGHAAARRRGDAGPIRWGSSRSSGTRGAPSGAGTRLRGSASTGGRRRG